MKGSLIVAGTAFAGFAGLAHAAMATNLPQTGVYDIVAFNSAQTGAACTGTTGGVTLGTLRYTGAATAGAVAYLVRNDNRKFGFFVIKFPATPAAGATSWKGTLTLLDEPSGRTGNAAFTATFTFINSGHFLLLLQFNKGGCLLTDQITAYSTH
jgi:hypothetical protein